jgi:tetratricopeptide (TPR) repeat protein
MKPNRLKPLVEFSATLHTPCSGWCAGLPSVALAQALRRRRTWRLGRAAGRRVRSTPLLLIALLATAVLPALAQTPAQPVDPVAELRKKLEATERAAAEKQAAEKKAAAQAAADKKAAAEKAAAEKAAADRRAAEKAAADKLAAEKKAAEQKKSEEARRASRSSRSSKSKKDAAPKELSLEEWAANPPQGFWTKPAKPDDPLAAFWNSETFIKSFLGSYGFHAGVEPKLATPEDQQFYQSIATVVREDARKAIATLEQYVTAETSAVLDYTLATLYFQEGEPAKAIKQYEIALAKFPTFLRAHKNLGILLVKEGRFADAVAPLTETVRLGGADGNVYGLLGFAFLNTEKFASAEAAYRNAILLQPDTLDWKLGLVKGQIQQGKYREAVDLLDELLQKNPQNDTLWALQANVLVSLEQPLKAAVNFEILRKLGKATPAHLLLLGDIYMTQDQRELALSAYLEAIEKDGGKSPAKALRAAEILASQGAWDEARALFAKIRATSGALADEDEMKLLKLESKVALATGEAEKAVTTLERVIERNPLDGEALLMVGEHYARNGEREKAEFRYEMAAKLEKFEADALVKHAQLHVQAKAYDKAVEMLRRAQKLKPRDSIQRYLEAVERVQRARRS